MRVCLFLAVGLLGSCKYHVDHFFMTSTSPVPEATTPGALVEHERCRTFLFYWLPVQRYVSPADELRELTAEGPLLDVAVEERLETWTMLVKRRCFRITGRRPAPDPSVAVDEVVEVAQIPAPPPPPELPMPEPQEVGGWPSLPLGTEFVLGMDVVRSPSDQELWVRPPDGAEGFLGLDVQDVVVVFVDNIAQRAVLTVPAESGPWLSRIWGDPRLISGGALQWRDRRAVATLKGDQLVITLP